MGDDFRTRVMVPPLPVDTSIQHHQCECSVLRMCRLCLTEGDSGRETVHVDPVRPGGPAVPTPYTASNDVNPVCGCHLRSKCGACSGCTSCDGCYCGEDDY
jgi:hypothetical protein